MGEAHPVEAVIRPLDRAGDLGWVVMTHGELYDTEFGWDTSFEALVARIVADYAAGHDPGREAAWIAEIDGQAADPARGPAGTGPRPGGSAGGYLPGVRATPGTRGYGCGPTTHWPRPGAFICSGASSSRGSGLISETVSTGGAYDLLQ